MLVAVAAGFGSAASKSYGGIIAGRAFVGFFSCAANVICYSIASDLFCLHERGKAVGIITVALIKSATLSHNLMLLKLIALFQRSSCCQSSRWLHRTICQLAMDSVAAIHLLCCGMAVS